MPHGGRVSTGGTARADHPSRRRSSGRRACWRRAGAGRRGRRLPEVPAAGGGWPERRPRREARSLRGGERRATGRVPCRSCPGRCAGPERLLLVGVGAGDEAGWRAAGAAVARAAADEAALTVALPAGRPPAAVRGLAEGLWLASYRFRLTRGRRRPAPADAAPGHRWPSTEPAGVRGGARRGAARRPRPTVLARDLTNTPSSRKNPAWFADQVAAGGRRHARADRDRARARTQLAAEGFGGILAVGGGSASPPAAGRAGLAPARRADRTSCWSARASPSTPAASRSSRATA